MGLITRRCLPLVRSSVPWVLLQPILCYRPEGTRPRVCLSVCQSASLSDLTRRPGANAVLTGEPAEISFDVGWTSMTFNKGHRIRVSIASSGGAGNQAASVLFLSALLLIHL